MARIIDSDRFRDRPAARNSGGNDGGNVDDIQRRLGMVESLVGETRVDVSAIKAVVPHLATKAEINEVRADIHALETRMIRWMVGTMIACGSLAFTVAKFVH